MSSRQVILETSQTPQYRRRDKLMTGDSDPRGTYVELNSVVSFAAILALFTALNVYGVGRLAGTVGCSVVLNQPV